MILTNFFIRKKILATTANLAKRRLQTIISKKRNIDNKLRYYNFVNLKNDLIQVIQKHIHETKNISVQFKQQDQNTFYLKCIIFFSNRDT